MAKKPFPGKTKASPDHSKKLLEEDRDSLTARMRGTRSMGHPKEYHPREIKPDSSTFPIISKAIKMGSPPEVAAATVGVNGTIYKKWMRKGRQDRKQGKYSLEASFYIVVRRAVACFEKDTVESIHVAGFSDWRAKAWLLARRFRKRWGDNKKTESVNVNVQQTSAHHVIEVDVRKLDVQDCRELIEADLLGKPLDTSRYIEHKPE